MKIAKYYNKYKNQSNIKMNAIKMEKKTIEQSAEDIVRILCDFNSHELNFDEFYNLIKDYLKTSIEIKNCNKNLYESICNKLNKIIGTDPLEVQMYRNDINEFLSDLYKKGEYGTIFSEKQFDIIYNKEQELKNFNPSWINNGISKN